MWNRAPSPKPVAWARCDTSTRRCGLPDGTVLVLGGPDARDWKGLEASTELYDLRQARFSAATAMATRDSSSRPPWFLLTDGNRAHRWRGSAA